MNYELNRERRSASYGATKRNLISILQLVVLRHTTGNDTNLHTCVGEFAVELVVRGVTLHRGTKGKNHFGNLSSLHTLHKTRYLQIAGTYALHR